MKDFFNKITVLNIAYLTCIFLLVLSAIFMMLGYSNEGITTVFAFTSGLIVKLQ